MSVKCTMILGDCLEVMPELPLNEFGKAFLDLPYGCTSAKWDTGISLQTFWQQWRRIAAATWTTCATAAFKFAVNLYLSNEPEFRYDLVFDKLLCSGFLRAKQAPLRYHENILVFSSKNAIFNPQRQPRRISKRGTNWQCGGVHESWNTTTKGRRYEFTDTILPRSVLPTMGESKRSLVHSAQKPVALLNWLIRTYSNPGNNVLDPVSGSGTTAVSAISNDRNVTCIEKDESYFNASVERVAKHAKDNNLDAKIEVRR